ncbi:MAG: metal ABC transporter permease [Bacteroidetes bacterium]|nr:metal ABC transporter permease [Bacteroidota bacterium]
MEGFWIILVAILVSLNNSLIGSFLVLRKSTMMADAISHAVLPGIVISYLLTKSVSSIYVIMGATASGILAIFLIGFFNKTAKLQIDASIGIVFTFLFAIGVILISLYTQKADLDQECVLYGEIVYIPLNLIITKNGLILGPKSFYILLFILILNLSFIIIYYRYLHITSFDESFASTTGINIALWNYLILILTALTTVASFESVGTILVLSFISIPTASAYLICKGLKSILLLSSLLGITSAVLGYHVANFLNLPIPGCMSMIAGGVFIICFIISKVNLNKF